MLKPTKILVPTDFSDYSDKALSQALDIAREYKARVYLLHVVNLTIQQCVVDYCLSEEMVKQIEAQAMNSARENLQKEAEKYPKAKEVEVSVDVRNGIPAEEILKEEADKGIDLIVIASLGKSGLFKYLIGSVARNVLKGSKCPVLLTK
jgi:universal stress protein A